MTPVRTVSNTALKQIKVAGADFAIAITPDGKTVVTQRASPARTTSPSRGQ